MQPTTDFLHVPVGVAAAVCRTTYRAGSRIYEAWEGGKAQAVSFHVFEVVVELGGVEEVVVAVVEDLHVVVEVGSVAACGVGWGGVGWGGKGSEDGLI